mgnify:CR=1 FL=1
MLAEKIKNHNVNVWLVNTGWSGGQHGTGARMKLSITRAIIDAIHAGTLADAPTKTDPVFGFEVVQQCESVTPEILWPKNTWADGAAYDQMAAKLAGLFQRNFEKYANIASDESEAAGPRV